jgi:cytochrome c-type biogenesis protein CcmH
MATFWIVATLMLLAALAFVLVPLLRTRGAAGPSAREANLAVLRGQRREIDDDVANGVLPAAARDEALRELVDRADAEVPPTAAQPAAGKRPWRTALAVTIALPALALGTYLALGVPAAADPQLMARASPRLDDDQILAMVESLAAKVRERPDDARGWALLARSMAALGRFPEAVAAYEHLLKIAPRDAQTLADYADALGMAQGRTLAGRPYELAREALTLEPKHRKALALAGTAAMDAGDFATATRYWETLASDLPTGSEDEAQVRTLLAELRLKASAAGTPIATASGTPVQSPAPVQKSVSGSVSVAPEVAAKVNVSDTVFVFARAEGGPRMPLAILRTSARTMPIAFALDDTMAMSPASRLSLAQAVRIEARISRSGDAKPQPGDLVGTSGVVKPGARDVKIVIDKVLP